MATPEEQLEQLEQNLFSGVTRVAVQADGAVDTTFASVEDRLKLRGVLTDEIAADAGTPRRRFVQVSTGKAPF